MKRNKFFLFILLIITFGFILMGCASFRKVSISSDLQTVIVGSSLKLSASGRNIAWSVDGSGSISPGTYVDTDGTLYVSLDETNSHLYVKAHSTKDNNTATKTIRIVTIDNVTVSPAENRPVVIGRTLQFRAQVSGSNGPDQVVSWRVVSDPSGFGSVASGTNINRSGLLTVSANEPLRTLYIVATSAVDPSKSGITPVTVVVPTVTEIVVSSLGEIVAIGRSLQFNAVVLGTYEPSQAVTWRVGSDPSGTGAVMSGTSINNNGVLTVSAYETFKVLYITATSNYDSTKSGIIPVAVVTPTVTSVTVNPSGQTIRAGDTFQFSALVTGTYEPDTTVTWKVSANPSGTELVANETTINSNGILKVANNEKWPILYVIATSTYDNTKSGNAHVNIIVPVVTGVTVSPANESVIRGGTFQFFASVTGTNNPSNAVTWKVSSSVTGNTPLTTGTNINANGLLTVSVSETANILYVFANSVFAPSVFGIASISIISPPPPVANPIIQNPPAAPPVTTPPPVITTPPATPPPVTPPVAETPPPVTPPVTPEVTPPAVTGVVVSPSTVSTMTNSRVQFNATVVGSSTNNAVSWKVSSNAAGTGAVANSTNINSGGLLTVAPNEWSENLYVFATSAADTSKTGLAVVTIINNSSNQGTNQGS